MGDRFGRVAGTGALVEVRAGLEARSPERRAGCRARRRPGTSCQLYGCATAAESADGRTRFVRRPTDRIPSRRCQRTPVPGRLNSRPGQPPNGNGTPVAGSPFESGSGGLARRRGSRRTVWRQPAGRRPAWQWVARHGATGPGDRLARRFGTFGEGSCLTFPQGAVFGERWIHIGRDTLVGPDVSLSAGMVPGQQMVTDPVVRIGDRCMIGRGSHIVGHFEIEIGDDVYTGPYVYVTDQNHGYEDPDEVVARPVAQRRPGADRRRAAGSAPGW